MWYGWTIVDYKKAPSPSSFHHTKKEATLARFILYPIILCHFTRHMMGRKTTYPFFFCRTLTENGRFSISASKYYQNVIVFWDFAYQKLIFIENKHHIRNHESKIHQKLYISSKNNSRQNFVCTTPQGFSIDFYPVVPYGWNFARNYFSII